MSVLSWLFAKNPDLLSSVDLMLFGRMSFLKLYILHDPVYFEFAADVTVFGVPPLRRTHHVKLGGLDL